MPITQFPIATKLATPADVGLAAFTGYTPDTLPISALVAAALAGKRAVGPVLLSEISTAGAVAGQVIKFNGTAWVPDTDNVGSGGGGGGGLTSFAGRTGPDILPQANDYSFAQIGSKPTTLSGYGIADGAPLSHVGAGGGAHADATNTVAGFMSAADKVKLTGIANGATANSSDALLLDRANHTGTQAVSTISGLQAALDAKAPINNPTFTGTVGGITAAMVGLGSVNNTSDSAKPVSTLQAAAIALRNVNIQFQDEGSALGAAGTVDTFNVVGSSGVLSRAGNVVTLTLSTPTPAVENIPTASPYTLVAADQGKIKRGVDTNPQTIIVPTAFSGFGCTIQWPAGSGTITLDAAAGVNLNGLGDGVNIVLSQAGGAVDLISTGANTWDVVGSVGDLQAADITNLASGIAAWLVTPTSANLRAAVTDETGTGSLVFATNPVLTGATAAADPSAALGLATKQYVDGLLANLGRRSRVRVATTANIAIATALNSGDAIDGVTLADDDLVLVKNQTAPAENGIYVAGATPARFVEFDTYNEHPGSLIAVQEGTAGQDTLWLCTSNAGGTLGTTGIVFSQLSAGGLSDGDKGDITVSGSGTSWVIDAGVVTLAKMANLAQDQFIGRVSASTGVPETATITAAARTVLDDTTVAAMLATLGGAPLASPTFTGTPAAPTAAAGTNTTQLATTAFVIGERAAAATLSSKIITMAAVLGADDTYEGRSITGRNAGATIAQWDAVYLGASFEWLLADANGSGTYPAFGLAAAAGTAGNPLTVVTSGPVRNDAWAWSPGLIYLSTTAGGLTQTPPSATGDKVQIIGYATSADSMMVDPSLEYLTAA
jgi:hypothetical protein